MVAVKRLKQEQMYPQRHDKGKVSVFKASFVYTFLKTFVNFS